MVVILSRSGTKSRRGSSVGRGAAQCLFAVVPRARSGSRGAKNEQRFYNSLKASVLQPLAITGQRSRDESHPIHANDATRRQ